MGSSRSDYQYGCILSQSSRINCYELRFIFHIQILVLTVLLIRDKTEVIYNLPPSNGWSDKEAEQHNESVSQNIS